MNDEILERLVLDRALDALPEDVEALLDDYLANNPAHAARLLQMEETVSLAKTAMKPPHALKLPPLKVTPLPIDHPKHNNARRFLRPLQMAAAFILGIGLSSILLRHTAPMPPAPATVMASAESKPQASASSFWSAERLFKMDSKTDGPALPRLSWTSPVRKPQLNY